MDPTAPAQGRTPRVAIAGASGFVGRALMRELSADHEVAALSRTRRRGEERVQWVPCDLFSLLQIERALEGADYGVYLVHSMLPARLTQARFSDMDLILADNFARAAKRAGLKQIVYLGGLIPDERPLSPHLASRLEVEEVLAARGVPVTVLRAGLVIGAGGSSFRMMLRLVERLPVMVCPGWTESRTQPVAVDDVVALLRHCVGNPAEFGQAREIGGPDVMTYADMMRRTAALTGRRRVIVTVPFFPAVFSVSWVRLITGAHVELIAPLIESLRHDMAVADRSWQEGVGVPGLPFAEALRRAVAAEREDIPSWRGHLARADVRTEESGYVVSIQRLPLPPRRNAEWVAREYARWLPTLLRGLVRVDVDGELNIRFRVAGLRASLLELSYSGDRSTPDRPLYYITGGVLRLPPAPEHGRAPARLEFRETPDGRYVMAAIFNYRPSIPWFPYRFTQAVAHLWVMREFGAHLARVRSGE